MTTELLELIPVAVKRETVLCFTGALSKSILLCTVLYVIAQTCTISLSDQRWQVSSVLTSEPTHSVFTCILQC